MSNNHKKSATDLEFIKKYMPKSQDDPAAQYLKEMLNPRARAGAGGTKAGLFGIRPNGLKRASEIVDYFTPGKIQKRPGNFTQEIKIGKTGDGPTRQDTPHMVAINVPRNFCADCDRTDRPSVGGALNFSFYVEDRPDLGIKAMEIICNSFCQECLTAYQKTQSDAGMNLIVPTKEALASRKQQLAAERGVRCKKNLENYIKVQRLTSHWEIYTDGRQC